ncbi:MAG: hypothetical protein ACFFD1_01565, partial [Candidatus Thorarchaeota archaeon]
MEILNIIANVISGELDISPPAARGIIKLSIKDEFGPFKPLRELKYSDMLLVVNNSLRKRFITLNIKNYEHILSLLR